MTGGAGSGRDLLVVVGGGGGRNGIIVSVCDRERKGGAARERNGVECSVCVNVFACNWMRNGQWIE